MSEIGNKLKNIRVKNGYSIEEVNKFTKIRLHILQGIEEGNYNLLPPVYMKAFISDYMKFLGLHDSVDEVLDELYPKEKIEILAKESADKVEKETLKPKNYDEIFSQRRIKKNFFNRTSLQMYLLYIALLLIVVVVLYFAFFKSNGKYQNQNASSNGESIQVIADENSAATNEPPSDSMTFNIRAQDTVWVRISGDGANSRQSVMYPGNEIETKAWEYLTISSDKASKLDIKRNGTSLPKLTNQGNAIRNVKITRNDIINPTSVFSDSTAKKRKIKKKEQTEKKELPYILTPSPLQKK